MVSVIDKSVVSRLLSVRIRTNIWNTLTLLLRKKSMRGLHFRLQSKECALAIYSEGAFLLASNGRFVSARGTDNNIHVFEYIEQP